MLKQVLQPEHTSCVQGKYEPLTDRAVALVCKSKPCKEARELLCACFASAT